MIREELKKELEMLGSSLLDERFREEYKVPEGFFERLQNEVIPEVGNQKKSFAPLLLQKRTLFSMAASLLILVTSYFIFKEVAFSEDSLDTLDNELVLNYRKEDVYNLSEELIISSMEEFTYSPLEEISTSEVFDYLEDELYEISAEELENI